MRKTILNMKKSLKDNSHIAFLSANDNFNLTVRKDDDIDFLDQKTLSVRRKNGRITLINLNLIICICIMEEWI